MIALLNRLFAKVRFDGTSCWLWYGHRDRDGYGRVSRDGTAHLAHRVMYAVLRGQPTNQCLMHSCDRRECVNPWHLTDATMRENNADRDAKGRTRYVSMRGLAAKGERSGKARLTEAKVRAVREMHRSGVRLAEIGRAMGVSEKAARDVVTGRTWRHVADISAEALCPR